MLELQNGWSPVKEMELNGDIVHVKCMTVEDTEKMRVWGIVMLNTFCK